MTTYSIELSDDFATALVDVLRRLNADHPELGADPERAIRRIVEGVLISDAAGMPTLTALAQGLSQSDAQASAILAQLLARRDAGTLPPVPVGRAP